MWIFINIITFFHRQIMCGCRLITCLYDIRQTSYECRLHHSLVAPSEPIWATFAPILGKYIPTADSSRHACPKPRRTAAIIYRHILLGEKSFNLIRTRAYEKIRLDFFRAEPLYVLYIAGKNVKNCKVTYARGFFASIYFFIWIKYSWGNMVIGNCWKFS